MSTEAQQVIIYAPRRLTPTERGVLSYVSHHEGAACTKDALASALGRSKISVDRAVSRLRSEGMLIAEPSYDENGGQRANVYRLAAGKPPLVAQPLD